MYIGACRIARHHDTDDHDGPPPGRGYLIGMAVTLILAAQLALTFFGFSVLPVFVALVTYFAGFNFLEAGCRPGCRSLADEDVRGASLGVFSSAQFLGAFVGGLIGGRFLGQGRPSDVFFVCALMGGIWLALQGFGKVSQNLPEIGLAFCSVSALQ